MSEGGGGKGLSERNFFAAFSGIPYCVRSIEKSTHAHNVFFGCCALLEPRVDEIKNSNSTIILKLPHPSFAPSHGIINSLGHPNVHTDVNLF